jgi:hypothetical protein
MLCMKIIIVCSEIHKEHRKTLCDQKLEFMIVQPGGMYNNSMDFLC